MATKTETAKEETVQDAPARSKEEKLAHDEKQTKALDRFEQKIAEFHGHGTRVILTAAMIARDFVNADLAFSGSIALKESENALDIRIRRHGGRAASFGKSRLLKLAGLYDRLGGDESAEKTILALTPSYLKPFCDLMQREKISRDDEKPQLVYNWAQGWDGKGPKLLAQVVAGKWDNGKPLSVAILEEKTRKAPGQRGGFSVERVKAALRKYYARDDVPADTRKMALRELYVALQEMCAKAGLIKRKDKDKSAGKPAGKSEGTGREVKDSDE